MKFPHFLQSAIALVMSIWLTCPSAASAQSDDTPIADQSAAGIKKADAAIIEKVKNLNAEKKLISRDDVKIQLANPRPMAIDLKPTQTQVMSEENVAAAARAANFRVGYCYLCPHCDNWHLSLAGGYPIGKDTVATCDHVIDTGTAMREGYLIVADHDGQIYPVTAIVARSVAMDAAIIRCEGATFSPVALNKEVKQGSAAYCYSAPMGQHGYFSDGIINRFFWNQKYTGGEINNLHTCRHLRVNFSTDWAPGSSGSAVMDRCGNVIGHVSQIASLSKGTAPAYVTIHTGIPAHSVMMLAHACEHPEEISQLCTMEAKENPVKKPETQKPETKKKAAAQK